MRLPICRFGEFELDPASRELSRGGQRVPLQPKSFECLAYLIAHRDRAVGRDELISAVWGRVDVSDTVVAQALLRVRRALDDTGEKQLTIRTIPRFGYRWVAPMQEVIPPTEKEGVETVPAESVAPDEATSPGLEAADATHDALITTRRFNARSWLGIGLLLAAITIGAAAFWLWHLSRNEPASQAGDTVLVLPVAVVSADNENAWVRLGAMDYIASRLRGSGMKVVPSDQAMHLKAQIGDSIEMDSDVLQKLQSASGARWIVFPEASHDQRGWRMRLRLREADLQQVFEARAATPLAAAAAASDSWLRRLGRSNRDSETTPSPLTERVQQIDAELLVGGLGAARRLIEAAPAQQRGDPLLRVREGQLEYRAGRIDEAARIFQEVVDRQPTVVASLRARALMGQGAVEIRRDNFQAAEARYSQALSALEHETGPADDPALVGNAYNGRGVARVQQGHMESAVRDMGMARIAMQRSGDLIEAAMVGTNLGMIEVKRGHYPQALREFEQAIEVFERFGVQDYLAVALMSKAQAQLTLVQPADAATSIQRAATLAQSLEDPSLATSIGLVNAEVLLANGRLREARKGIDDLGSRSDLRNDQKLQELQLRLLLSEGESRPAGALAKRHAVEGGEVAGALALVAVQAALRSHGLDTARKLLSRSPVAGDATTSVDASLSWDMARALVAQGEGRTEDATRAAQRAVESAERTGMPNERVSAGVLQATLLLRQGQRDAATAALGDLDAFASSDYRVAWATLQLYRALGDADMAANALKRTQALRGERDIGVEPVL